MNSHEIGRVLRSFSARLVTTGLIVCASQTTAVVGPACAADSNPVTTASTQQTAWTQGVILAEIAWLGNPATFHERLNAVQVGECLEIHGTVSNDSTRNLAMKLAREASHMTTVDHTQLAAAPVVPVPARSLNNVYRDAVQALYHSCPQLSRSLTVSTQDRGEVLIRGEVATLEDRLAISRALKTVAGCNCVKNQVRAKAMSVNALTTIASKPTMQDNSLLVRLGIMQPRTETLSSTSIVAHNAPTYELPRTGGSTQQLVSLPTAPARTESAKSPVLPTLIPTALEQSKSPESAILLTSAPTSSASNKLRNSIALTCGLPDTWVTVAPGEGKSLAITLSVASLESGKQLAERVLAMPELVPYGVTLDVTLAK